MRTDRYRHRNSPARLWFGGLLLLCGLGLGSTTGSAQSGLGDLGGTLTDAVGGILSTPALPGQEAPSQELPSRASSAIDLATSAVGLLNEESPGEEIAVGRAAAAQLLGAAPLVDDQRIQTYVNTVGLTLVERGERASLPWKFAVIDTPSINAFALPGGIVLVTSGLYRLLQSEDELAAVLGHEIVHVQRQHHFKVIKQQRLVGAISGAVTSEVANDQEVVALLAGRATEVLARGLDKDAEYEADRDGIVVAARAGYDSSALFSVLEKIRAAGAQGADTSFIFSTHPTPNARMAALAETISPDVERAAVPSAAARRILGYALPQ